jgi:hypothetical protein
MTASNANEHTLGNSAFWTAAVPPALMPGMLPNWYVTALKG